MLVIAGALSIVSQAVTAPPAAAAIAEVQQGTEVSSTNASTTPTLSSASTAGNLLVAVVAVRTSAAFSAPANWVNATFVNRIGIGRMELWYYPNNPGGITSATFTVSSGSSIVIGQMGEYQGVAFTSPVDQTGTLNSGSGTTQTVSTSSATTITGDLAIAAFETQATPIATFTAGAGWAHNFSDGTRGYVADDKLGNAIGTISETQTATTSTNWASLIVAFKPGCTSGSLALTAPTSVTFPSVTLNGKDQTSTIGGAFTPNDQTNSNAGWNIAGTSTTFTNAGSKTLPTTATRVTATSVATASQNCSLPTNSVTYPTTLPAAATAPAAVKLYNAAVNTGAGPSTVTMTFVLSVPAKTYNGTYTSTWTFTISSGP